MPDILGESLRQLKKIKARRMRIIAIVLVLSLLVSLDVFWVLRQPGLTLAGDADCGIVEHTHDANCEMPCPLTEHIHTIDCYSDENADTELLLDWQKMFDNYPYTGDLSTDLIGIAKTQAGYTESKENFQVGDDGVTRGYTRYGAWYGVPYNDWSALFVSFCLHYAGADPGEYPGNIGANAMAEQWKKLSKFAAAGQHTPRAGDLVFFTDNTVGIVTDVLNSTINVVRGDAENAVRSSLVFLGDSSIAGWGLLNGIQLKPPDTGQGNPLDISGGPAVFLYEGGETVQPQKARYSIRRSARTVTDLMPYLEENEGSYFFTLLDFNNTELPKDANGNYIVQASEGYKLTLTFNSPRGFHPGTYQYQIPNGLMVDGGEGTFTLKDGTTVGTWVVTDTGLITLDFNESINNHTDITISAALGIHFPEQDDPIDFDGKITVKVEPPVPQKDPTVLQKWGQPDDANGKLDWFVLISGHADSQIPGSIITDQATLPDWGKPHTYTESDIAAGLTFGVTDANGGWHNWTVYADDPHLIWDENGWSYKMPHTVICDYCGELELGNNGWYYQISYSSTPTALNTPGNFAYENKVTADGQTAWGWNSFTYVQADADIIKNGSFISDAADGGFLWEIQTTIPGRPEGQKAQYGWGISDEMRLLDANGTAIGQVHNDINLATVYATYNGTLIPIPRIQDATDADMFAWDNAWTTEDGTNSTRTINLLSRCQCTPESCHWSGCGDYWFQYDDGTWGAKGFCQCWTETQNMTFTLVYKTTDMSLVEHYGALGYALTNRAQLFYLNDNNTPIEVDKGEATVSIPNLFKKELTHDFNGYTANYKITVNKAKLSLTDGSPLYIRDEMTKTLAYISGSLIITAEDANGNVTELQQDVDYTVTYDGTGGQKDAAGNVVHVLDIVVLHPQPVMYTLDYDTTLIIPDKVTEGVKYSNSAAITLWGESIKDNATEKVYADINISSKSHKVQLLKTSAMTGDPLGGATFGLFNAHGGLIAADITDANGHLTFRTNVVYGIILREHILYYLQELESPPGYRLDDTQYWFCFCDKTSDSCEICDEILAGIQAVRIPYEQIGNIRIVNEIINYDLPGTGGPGIYPLILVSVVFIITPLVYISIRRRKRERRDTG